jgi:integrase
VDETCRLYGRARTIPAPGSVRCFLSRLGDLPKLKVEDVKNLQPGETFTIIEQKTRKANVVMINKEVRRNLAVYLDELKPSDGDYLFKSRIGKNQPLNKSYVNALIKKWTSNIKGDFGTHSLRKTFGFIQRKVFGTSFEVICKRFNHSNPSITMRYLGIEGKEVNGILLNEI